mgnify:CR=1 FL=1
MPSHSHPSPRSLPRRQWLTTALPLLGASAMIGALAIYSILVTARRPLTPG